MEAAELAWRSDFQVKLVRHMAHDLYVCEAARVSTTDHDEERYLRLVTELPDVKLIEFLMRERHGSPFEHAVFTFYIEVPIVVAWEWFRHRMASYNVESGRYKVLKGVFYVPPPDRPLVQTGKPGRYKFVPGTRAQHAMVVEDFQRTASTAYSGYRSELENGVARELARMQLPFNIYTSFYWTVNARSLMNFLSLRVYDPAATFASYPMWEMEQAARLVEEHFAATMPVVHEAFHKFGRTQP